jgi:hypothetical protein
LNKDYKGSLYNIVVEWETGATTYERLDLIAEDDPVSCAEYGSKNQLLEGQSKYNIKCMVKKAKLTSYRRDPFWKFVVLVSCTHAQAV